RAAAIPALAQIQKEHAAPLIIQTLLSDDVLMRRAAISAIMTVPGNVATKAFAGALSGLAPDGKAALLAALASRGDAAGISSAINQLATDQNLVARQAAIKALARLGNAASIPVLTSALKEGGAIGADASRALAELQGEGITAALIEQAGAGDVLIRDAI